MRVLFILITLLSFSTLPTFGADTISSNNKVYQQYCAGCHETGTGNAPLRKDLSHWKKRQAQTSKSELTETVIMGKGAMPEMGGCTDCTEAMIRSAVLYLIGANSDSPPKLPTSVPLEKIKLPEGFHIQLFAKDLPGARFMARGDKGTIFVGTKSNDKVYALIPDADGSKPPRKMTLLTGLNEPNGVAFHKGALYVAEIGRILKIDDVEEHLNEAHSAVVINKHLPTKLWHGLRVIAIGPDEKLYVTIGMPCNTCNYRGKDRWFGTISKMDLDGTKMEPYAIGIRNSVGITWHPDTGVLWFSDNGQDMLGDDIPSDEINYAPKSGMDFGFPYVYGDNVIAPDYVKDEKLDISGFTKPAWKLQAHVAPLDIKFYTGTQFPKAYQKQLFVASHGSWNRSKKVGYEVMMLTVDKNKVTSMKPFATGWLQGQEAWGRPVGLLEQPDGSLLVSDDLNGVIYQITYVGK